MWDQQWLEFKSLQVQFGAPLHRRGCKWKPSGKDSGGTVHDTCRQLVIQVHMGVKIIADGLIPPKKRVAGEVKSFNSQNELFNMV